MLGKKTSPLPPYFLQVLTTEYLIEGMVPGNTALYFCEPDKPLGSLIRPTPARIQSTQNANLPAREVPQFVVMGGSSIALIPHMDITQMAQYVLWKTFPKQRSGIFFIGPYMMRGKLMMLTDDIYKKDSIIYDVNITSQGPGSAWSGLSSPFALVNTPWILGFIPD
jgi:hypothetical protein